MIERQCRPRRPHFLLLLAALTACGGGAGGAPRGAPPGAPPRPAPDPRAGQPTPSLAADGIRMYQQMGLLARGVPLPFVGSVGLAASGSPDSTHVVLALSMGTAGLTFDREADAYRASYTVGITVRRDGEVVKDIQAHEAVRVATFKETSRAEESLLFQQVITLPPGTYGFAVAVKDDASGRTSAEDVTLAVPALGPGALALPIPVYQATPRTSRAELPRLLVNPRATFVFGRDSVATFYLESYAAAGPARLPLRIETRSDAGQVLWSDTASLARRGDLYADTVRISLARLGIGPSQLGFIPQVGRPDTVRTPVFIGFGDDLPVASFEDMLTYLRWYASPGRLKELRETPPADRPTAWLAFVKATDPLPLTPQHEGMRDYFQRIARANARYREEGGAGWLTDRGKVYVAFGDPDGTFDQATGNFQERGRTLVWTYRNPDLQLVFVDQSGFGRWRLTQSSETAFEQAFRRRVQDR